MSLADSNSVLQADIAALAPMAALVPAIATLIVDAKALNADIIALMTLVLAATTEGGQGVASDGTPLRVT